LIDYMLSLNLSPDKINIVQLGLLELDHWVNITGKPRHLVLEGPIAVKSLLQNYSDYMIIVASTHEVFMRSYLLFIVFRVKIIAPIYFRAK